MIRQPRFFILAFFFVSITSNFIQAAQISLSHTATAESLLSRASDAKETDDSTFIVPEDDSDDTPCLILAQSTIQNIQSAFLILRLNVSAAVMTVPAERHTVLRL